MAVLARESQYLRLLSALEGNLPQSLLIWGPPSTGKSFVLEKIIKECKIGRLSKISAIEIMCGKRPFFETLLNQLTGGGGDGEEENLKCENLRVFVRQLRKLYNKRSKNSTKNKEKTVIIIEQAEYLRNRDYSEILGVFARLQELIQSHLCVVIFSSIVSSTGFSGISSMRAIPSIHFPQYSKEEVVNIITSCHVPKDADIDVFSGYVGMIVDVFYQSCRDLKKLLRLTLSNWEYVQERHKEKDDHKKESLHKIWKDIVPQLRQDFKALNSSFLPMTLMENGKAIKSDNKQIPTINVMNKSSINSTTCGKERNYEDIAKHTRYILIASYLATHNPPFSDKRFFVKGSTRRMLGGGGGKKNTKINIRTELEENENSTERTKALRSFDQNRLKSIFAFLVSYCSGGGEVYEGNVDWLMQISSLVQSQFIQQLGEDTSGNIKYRCLADFDFIQQVSTSVDFELEKHLYRLL